MISRVATGRASLVASLGAAIGLAIWATVALGLVGSSNSSDSDARVPVVDSSGVEVGYVFERDLEGSDLPPSEVAKIVNERGEATPRRIPVRSFEDGRVVGHMVDNVGYVPLDE